MRKKAVRTFFRIMAIVAAAAFLAAGNITQPASADPYFDYGVKMVQQRNFKVAAQYMDMRLKSNPNDAYAQYYRGLCHHVGGEMDKAKELYQTVLASGADANIKALAANQLKRIESAAASTDVASSKTTGGSAKSAVGAPPPSDPDDEDQQAPTIIPPNARAYFTITPGGNDRPALS